MFKKRMAAIGVAVLVLLGASALAAGPAQAMPGAPATLDGYCDPGEACLFYNSNLDGGIYDVTWDIRNYDIPSPAKFICNTMGRGDACAGAGQGVWNNAASVYNNGTCALAVFYNSDFNNSVYVQVIPAHSWANLAPILKNNNASQGWDC